MIGLILGNEDVFAQILRNVSGFWHDLPPSRQETATNSITNWFQREVT